VTEKVNINNSLLGQEVSTPSKYDASFLFRIPRDENRVKYNIDGSNLPFIGVDVWNCYELSFLTKNGLPVSRVVKLIYSADSEFLVESKSLKLYLNSFNMERFEASVENSIAKVREIISRDLSDLLKTQVSVIFFNENDKELAPFPDIKNINQYISQKEQEKIVFEHYTETPELLRSTKTAEIHHYSFQSDLLRSNCRVTNQPDWGDLFVRISTKHALDFHSIIQYLVSFREENHFHEEVVEMIYKRFWNIFEAEELMIAAMYTRRGGIDINPIRASHESLLDSVFLSKEVRLAKTLRQ
jgi:7-cyano-7-deazaguanine reductase